MRIAFLVALLGGAVFYSYIAFVDLRFMTHTGRLGPGFFPRIVGAGMVLMTLLALLDALRDRRAVARGGAPGVNDAPEGSWGDLILLVALALLYAIMLRVLGGFVSTVIFLGIALSLLNPGRHLQNVLVTVLFPVAVYVLFDRLLNASMPPALIALPF